MKVETKQVTSAVKWSLITEVIVKLISPITNMILARLLVPEAFGIIASITMITTFADMFTDAGFQKYIVQHQFSDHDEQDRYVSVAFWSNFLLSCFLYLVIFFTADKLAVLSGIAGYGNVIRIYSVILLLTSFSSIQYAVYKKKFQYKKLGIIRVTVKLIPLVVTVPLTLWTRSFWALVIGNLTGEAVAAVVLMLWSDQRIKFFYSFSDLKKMFSFCGGSMLETISSWLVSNVSVFIIGQYLGSYYLGLYKTSITTVNQVISIITASTMSVLFATLSQEQDDDSAFRKTIATFQRSMGLFTVPLGVGILVFRKFITLVLLGGQWSEAAIFVGLWGFVMCESVIFADIGSYSMVAKGRPVFVFISNMIQAVLLSIVLYAIRDRSFVVLAFSSFIVRWQLTATHYGLATKVSGLKLKDLPKELGIYLFAAVIMGVSGWLLLSIIGNSILASIVAIIVCVIIYFVILLAFKRTREQILGLVGTLKSKLNRSQA